MKKPEYRELISELYNRRTKGIKLGLERVFSVLEKLDNPHKSFKSIHIAGTNGKGSVSKIIYNLLRNHGVNTGVFTSPHLTRFTERIVVNDCEISEDEVIELVKTIKPFADELTFFEYVTVMAFVFFREKGVDYAVIETGMGGRLDSTNVVTPVVSVITSIGLDHQEFLGNDIKSIAKEKAGIIKKGVPVVLSKQEKDAEEVIYEKARELGCPVFTYGRDFFAQLKAMDLNGITFIFNSSEFGSQSSEFFLPLTGFHQLENVAVALKAFLTAYSDWRLDLVKEGLKNVKIPGRLEVVSNHPLVIFDIAHNSHAAKNLVKSLKTLTDKKPVVVFGMMRDKDIESFVKYFENYAHKLIFTVPHYERALTVKELDMRIPQNSSGLIKIDEPLEAFKEGLSFCEKNDNLYLLCTGSAYLIGELKEYLGDKTLHRCLGELI